MIKQIFYSILVLPPLIAQAQQDTSKSIQFSGYAEIYYSYDFDKPTGHNKPNFIYNHNRHNEVNVNLAIAKVSYRSSNVRANGAIMTGTYAQYNLSEEPTLASIIYEMNVGIKLSKNKNIWIDAGIMPSHIGFESAIGADCWNLTRSILAENSPYYETGIKLSYSNAAQSFTSSLFLLNGWQRITRSDFTNQPSFGMQLTYTPNQAWTINYSTYYGPVGLEIMKIKRLFHNFYAIYNNDKKVSFTFGFDYGNQSNSLASGSWYSPVLIMRYTLNDKLRIALRGEYYADPENIIVSYGNSPFKVMGISTNLDLQINKEAQWRSEIKLYSADEEIFGGDKNNLAFTTAITLKL